jgi:hypothetical protein
MAIWVGAKGLPAHSHAEGRGGPDSGLELPPESQDSFLGGQLDKGNFLVSKPEDPLAFHIVQLSTSVRQTALGAMFRC